MIELPLRNQVHGGANGAFNMTDKEEVTLGLPLFAGTNYHHVEAEQRLEDTLMLKL